MNVESRRLRAQSRLNEVDEAARRVIVRKGLASTTMRDISREGGFTTGVLTHYFPDKEALITVVFSSVSEHWIERVRTALAAAHTASEQLHAVVDLAIPADPDERRDWRLWTEMWNYAGDNPAFAEQVIRTDAQWEAELRSVLERSIGEGLFPADLDTAVHARIIARLVDGLGMRSVLSGRWDEARAALIAHLRALGLSEGVAGELSAATAS
jgi:AcrR family transcriptional regulator